MKRILLIIALVISCACAHALSVDALFSKYRNLPGVVYRKVNKKELRQLVDSVSSDTEKEVLRTLQKMEVLMILDDELEGLTDDLGSLKGYSLIVSYNESDEDSEAPANIIQSMIASLNNDSVSVDVYVKDSSSDEYLEKPVFFVRFGEMRVLVYLDGRIKPDNAKELIKVNGKSI